MKTLFHLAESIVLLVSFVGVTLITYSLVFNLMGGF